MPNTQLKYDNFFYPNQDLVSEKHCRKIYGQTIDNDDIRRYRRFVKDCFGLHLLKNPKQLLIKDIQLAPKESNRFFNSKDISNLFISQIYKYPSIKRYHEDDLSIPDETIFENKVFDEILGHIANPNNVVVLIGDVGEGKSAFLQRLSIDLCGFVGDQKYLPIIIDVENYKDIIEKDNETEAFEGFWRKVCEDIILHLELGEVTASTVSETYETSTSTDALSPSTVKSINDELRSAIKLTTRDKSSSTSTRSFDILSQIQNAAKKLHLNNNARMVLVFDNLDTFCYEHERFMLFRKGFSKLKTKILTVRKIINEVISHLSHSEISFIFTARPYVYYHAFQRKVHETPWNNISAVYSIESSGANVPMKSRLELIDILSNKLSESEINLPDGKKEAVSTHHKNFKTVIDKCMGHKEDYMQKFYNLSNQGMRSMVEFYKSCDYHPDLFDRYFTHNILYLYMLAKKELYSQLRPTSCGKEQRYYFPNMFLIMCTNYRNREYAEACLPHKITYWLKYLILWTCYVRKRISIKNLLDIFSDYEDHVVRLCIGSLATVNEYNCLKMEFGHDIDFSMATDDLDESLNKFEETTSLFPTHRGKYMIENRFCLGFECLQLYIDDWLFQLPKKNLLSISDEILKNIYEPAEKKHTYNYLLSTNNYEIERKAMIRKKAKQSLLLLKFLEGAFKAEQEQHKDTWDKINNMSDDNSLFHKNAFESIQSKLIDDAGNAYGKDQEFQETLEKYNNKLNACDTQINNLFKKAIGITIVCT